MSMYYYLALSIVGVLVIWAVGSHLVVRNIAEPEFVLVERRDGYEIRDYAPYIIAETDVVGSYDEATREGFRIIADYIFGNNTSLQDIAMTAPVLENRTPNTATEKIAMTAPVLSAEKSERLRTVSFVMPPEYTLETLPEPNNPKVTITSVPARRVAVLSFTWYPTAKRIAAKKEALVANLERDGLTIDGAVQVARYNPPLSMPLLLRNEIIIPIK